MKTVRLTMAQALVRFLENQYLEVDGAQHRFVRGIFIIPGHGNVVGLGQALSQEARHLEIYQGKNEQGMAQAAVAFAKQMKRKQICVATSSVGPGAANMVTACGTATANNIPLLVLPGDTYACRQPDPVLQQVEHTNSLATTTNDAFKAVCRYWDRIVRPEQLMSAMINAFRVLTDPANTGAVCVAMPQDVEGEAYDYPVSFFAKRVWRLERRPATEAALADAAEAIRKAKGNPNKNVHHKKKNSNYGGSAAGAYMAQKVVEKVNKQERVKLPKWLNITLIVLFAAVIITLILRLTVYQDSALLTHLSSLLLGLACGALFYIRKYKHTQKSSALYSIITVVLVVMCVLYVTFGTLGLLGFLG